jgi:hypothetical protein
LWIDKFKKDNDYVDSSDCHWGDDPVDFIQGSVLDFCCCGQPENNLEYIGQVLRHVLNLKEKVWAKEWEYDHWVEEGSKIGTSTQLDFVYYFLDQKGLTEHGGSIPGWLTDYGENILKDIEQISK